MKNNMPRSQVKAAPVIELAAKTPRRAGNPAGTVMVLRSGSPVPPAPEARAQPEIPDAAPRGPSRIVSFLGRLIARIDVKDFPGSCCG
jgi:hypothetical protein